LPFYGAQSMRARRRSCPAVTIGTRTKRCHDAPNRGRAQMARNLTLTGAVPPPACVLRVREMTRPRLSRRLSLRRGLPEGRIALGPVTMDSSSARTIAREVPHPVMATMVTDEQRDTGFVCGLGQSPRLLHVSAIGFSTSTGMPAATNTSAIGTCSASGAATMALSGTRGRDDMGPVAVLRQAKAPTDDQRRDHEPPCLRSERTQS
jgi:hypothetical protein